MSAIDNTERLIQVAEAAGYQIRHEFFGGTGGGICEFGGQKLLFIDLALSTIEQTERLRQALIEAGVMDDRLVAEDQRSAA